MNLVLLTETIVKMIVVNEDAVSAREYETTEENMIHLEVMVDSEDLGRVIGKAGKTINSIRNIVQASSSLNNGPKIKIDIESY